MGLDIYAGTLTRYYARNWKTSVQQWGERNGFQVNMVRPDSQNVELAPAEEIMAGVTQWRDQLLEALSASLTEKPYWSEDNDVTPYYTDKPDWDAWGALLLYTVYRASGKPVPETIARRQDVFEDPVYKRFMKKKDTHISLFECDWWLPIRDSFMFNGFLPTGDQQTFATVGMLKSELEAINALAWKADEQTILNWSIEEGYPADAVYQGRKVQMLEKHQRYDTVSLAKFAFSILWQAVRHSEEHGTLIICDF